MLLVLAANVAVAADLLERDPEGGGVGIMLGEPTGISLAYRPGGRVWYDGALAWSIPNFFQVHSDACIDLADLRTADLPDMHFPLWIGAGVRARLGGGSGYDEFNLGVRVPLGFGFWHNALPIEGFFELVPGVGVFPRSEFIFDGGVGARIYFPVANTGKRYATAEPDPY